MRYNLTAEDFDDFPVAACNAEPLRRPDHKAKKHGRPSRGRSYWHAEHYARRARIAEHNAWAEMRDAD